MKIREIWIFFRDVFRMGAELRIFIFEWLLFSGLKKKGGEA
jgi:hypothetical protein